MKFHDWSWVMNPKLPTLALPFGVRGSNVHFKTIPMHTHYTHDKATLIRTTGDLFLLLVPMRMTRGRRMIERPSKSAQSGIARPSIDVISCQAHPSLKPSLAGTITNCAVRASQLHDSIEDLSTLAEPADLRRCARRQPSQAKPTPRNRQLEGAMSLL